MQKSSVKNKILVFLLLIITACAYAQKFSTDKGDIDNIQGVSNYNIIFEYDTDLKIPNYTSEEDFLEFQVNKRERKEVGSGKLFQKLWFENRVTIYEPKFIEQFNNFRLKKRVIHVGKNNIEANYTMVVKVFLIYPGYDVSVYEEEAKLDVTISIYNNEAPNNMLYTTKIFRIHGKGASNTEYERVMTAYSELGRWSSKHFCRKT